MQGIELSYSIGGVAPVVGIPAMAIEPRRRSGRRENTEEERGGVRLLGSGLRPLGRACFQWGMGSFLGLTE